MGVQDVLRGRRFSGRPWHVAEGQRAVGPGARREEDRRCQSQKPAHLRDPFTDPSVSYLPKGEAALSQVEPRALLSIALSSGFCWSGIGYGGWAVLQEVQKVRLTPVDQTPEVLAELDPAGRCLAPRAGSRGDRGGTAGADAGSL